MFRVFAALAISGLFAPALVAQKPLVCVFQQKQGHTADVDAGLDSTTLAKELTARTSGGAPALDILPVAGFSAKEIDAEADRRKCTWVVTLWRQQLGAATPNYGGTLGNTQASGGQYNSLMLKDTKIGADTLLDYSLRKAGDRKPIAHGEGDDDSTYAKFADAIVKKIEKQK